MSEDAGEFVTVPVAARRLGISERTAQRHAAKLADSDRQTPTVGAKLVRLSALAALSGKTWPPVNGASMADSDGDTARHSPPLADDGGQEPTEADTVADTGRHAAGHLTDLVETLRTALEHEREGRRADVERWAKALDQAQQLHLGTMAELQELRRRAAELEAANMKLLAALPATVTATEDTTGSEEPAAETPAGNAAQRPLEAPESGSSPSGAETSGGGGDEQATEGRQERRPGFWARLLGRG